MRPTIRTIQSMRRAVTLGVMMFTAVWLSATPNFAQETDPIEEVAPKQEAETQARFPAGLDNQDMGIEEFKLRLIPLTTGELSALAERWQVIVRGQTDSVVDATVKSKKRAGGQGKEYVDRIAALTDQRNHGFLRYSAVVTNLKKKGGDEAEIAAYRAYRNAIVLDEKQQANFRTLATQALGWVKAPDGGLKVALEIGVVVGSLLGLLAVARIIRGYTLRLFKRVSNLSKLLQGFLASVVFWVTIVIGLTVVLSGLGFDVTPIFALFGGASFILAFAMQDSLSNLASGLMIMFNHPFDEGDYIAAGGTAGTVKSVSIVSTTIATPDNQVIVIPNSMVWGDVITNSTASKLRRVDLQFGIDYNDDADQAIQAILDVAKVDDRVLGDPQPWVRVTNLGESSVDLTARLWCKADDYWDLKFALTKEVKSAFDDSGISIPYPHRVEITKAG